MPVFKTCIHCGSEFKVPPCRAESAKTCSKACKYATHPKVSSFETNCLNCGIKIHTPNSHRARGAGKYCSMLCRYEHMKSPAMSKKAAERISGENNPMWSGGVVSHSGGWVYEYAPYHSASSNGYVFQHRLRLEERMKKEAPDHPWLAKGFIPISIHVHHRNKDKSDNSTDNLMAMTRSAHMRWHNSGRLPDKEECWPHVHPGIR